MGFKINSQNKPIIKVLIFMLVTGGAFIGAFGPAAAQEGCVLETGAIVCRIPPERPLIVVGRQWEEVNEGTLEATGVQPVGAALWGSGNRLLNAAGARIDVENAPAAAVASLAGEGDDRALPAVGVRIVNFGGAHASGRPHLENQGVIQAVGTAATPPPADLPTPPPGGSGSFFPPIPIPLPIPPLFPPDHSDPEPPPPDDPSLIIPYQYWGVTGVRLWGHGVEALNTGTIRGVDNGGGDIYQPAVGLLSGYLPLVGMKGGTAATDGEGGVHGANRIVNRGTDAFGGLIEAEGHRATGLLLLGYEPGEGTAGSEGWQHDVFNDGGTIRAVGRVEAIGVDIVGGTVRLRNEGIIEAVALDPGGAAAGLRVVRPAEVDEDKGSPSVAPLAAATAAEDDGAAGIHVTNAMLIRVSGSTAVGVLLDEDGVTYVNEETGVVQAEGDSAIGVWVTGDDNEVINRGVIEARRKEGEEAEGEEAEAASADDGEPARGRVAAVALDGKGGTVVNEQKGTIRGVGADAVGVDMRGDANSVENAGYISGEAVGIAVGLADPGAQANIHNNEGGVVTGASGIAIATYAAAEDDKGAGSVHIVNEGTILGDVQLLHGGPHTVDSSGFVDGDIILGAGDDHVHIHDMGIVRGDIDTGAGADTVEISGAKIEGDIDAGAGDDEVFVGGSTVTGDVRLGAGDDELTVTTKAKIEGAIDGGEGENTLILTGDETGQLRGVENFRWVSVEDDGEWEFGQLSVDGSRMDVEGELTAGVVWIGPEGTLGIDRLVVDNVSIYDTYDYAGFLAGSGEIDGSVTMKGGFLSPGEAEGDIARLTIRGDYVQEKDAVYVVDVSAGPVDEAGYRPSDRIVLGEGDHPGVEPATVTAADADEHEPTALFAEGTVIHVRAARGYYDPQSTYLILDGALHEDMDEERLASIVVTTNTRFLVPTLKEGSLVLVLTKDFTRGARTPNQKSVGRGISNSPGGSLPAIEEALMFDLDDDGDAIRDALDQLSGEIYTTYLGVGETSFTQFARMMRRGMDLPVPVKDKKLWADVYGHFGEVKATAGTARAEYEQFGLVFGFGRDVSPRSRFGLMGGINRTLVDMPARNSKSSGSGWQLGAYGRWRGETSSLTGIVAFTEGRHDVERNIRFGSYNSLAKGRVRERSLGAHAEGRLHYEVSGFQVEPMLGFTWMDLSQSGVKESSGGEAALDISKTGRDVLRLMAGVRVGTKPMETGVWPEFLLAWAHDFRDIPNEIDVRFQKSPDYSFPIEGTKVGRSALIAGVSMEGIRRSGMTWQFGYRGEFRNKRTLHTGTLSFHFPF